MNIFAVAVASVLAGIPLWIFGTLIAPRNRADESGEIQGDDEKKPLSIRLYSLTCFIGMCGFIYVQMLAAQQFPEGVPIQESFRDVGVAVTSFTGDPVLQWISYGVLGIVALSIAVGVVSFTLYFIAVLLAVGALLSLVVAPLMALGRISPAGAAVAGLLASVPIVLLVRQYRGPILRIVTRVVGPAYGLVFDWWLTPLLRQRKENRRMDELYRKRSQCEALVLKLQAQDPAAVADIQFTAGSDTWLERVIERFHDRDRQKSLAERTRLVAEASKYFSEYRAMLLAHHELSRAGRDATLRDLQRDKEELTLRNDIADLEELRSLDRETQKITKQHALDQLKRKMAGGPEESPYKQGMKDKKARRLVDIEDHLFEALEHPVQTEVEARVLYKKLRQRIDRHSELSDADKDELLERLRERCAQLFKSMSSSRIFEDD